MNWFRFRGVTITREGLYYLLVFLFILVGAIIRDFQLLMVLACMLLGPIIYNALFVYRSLRGLRFTRRVTGFIGCGDSFFVDLNIANVARKTCYAVVVRDEIEQIEGAFTDEPQQVETFFARISRRDETHSNYRGVIHHRGKYRIGPLTVTTAFPLGMMRSTRIENVIDHLVVTPRIGMMTPAWRRLIQMDKTGFSSSRRRHGLLEGDFYGLRDWRNGDSKQWIHWRSSAKRGQLVVRQFEKQNQQDFALFVEAKVPRDPTPADLAALEQTISMAATAVQDLAAIGGCHLQLVCRGEKTNSVAGNVNQAFMVQALTNLAVLTKTHQDGFENALVECLLTAKPSTRIIVLSGATIDLTDTSRFEKLWRDTQLRAELGRIKTISAESGEIDTYFHLPPLPTVEDEEE
ncbi:MAG: DUF58 domain-containing protein [Pirellulaceae bacterium]